MHFFNGIFKKGFTYLYLVVTYDTKNKKSEICFQSFSLIMSMTSGLYGEWLEWYGIDKQTMKYHNKATVTITGNLIGFIMLYSLIISKIILLNVF